MSKFGSPSDEGSPSSSSRFELAMLESSRPLLESCTKETLDDFRNCQTLANIGSSFFMSVGEGVVFDAIPIFRSEFTTDLLEKNLVDSERQLEALRLLCSIPCSVGMHLVYHEELPSEPPKGYVMFYTQILLTLGPSFHQWGYCYKMRPVKACPGYAECACWSERERIVFVTRGNIKLFGRELADVEKVLKVPKEDRHLGKLQPLFQKYSFQTLVSECQRRAKRESTHVVDDILFHKGARKHRVRPAPRPKSQEEVFKITAQRELKLRLSGCRSTVDEFGKPLDENESDRDWIILSLLQVISVPWMAKGLAIGAPEFVGTRVTDANNFKSSTGTTASVPKASENEVSLVEVRYEVKTSLVELVINDQVAGRLVSNLLSLDFIIWEGAMNKVFINWGDPAILLLAHIENAFVGVQLHSILFQDGEGFRQVGNVLVGMFAFD
ncbi:hypothetical protein D8674_011494 [Pyrus ussuriensis x Pyrus communis]|uniref:Uncharacterized protein n=1 Tax=Pyrus ussuriensis x Pyrus communis TaxID=2448454 RepID=A0A5N5FZ04_9ROSA|nr:hypothetical protein D8674_011494 [Pyrus ussuriensis x Pyrus communis]